MSFKRGSTVFPSGSRFYWLTTLQDISRPLPQLLSLACSTKSGEHVYGPSRHKYVALTHFGKHGVDEVLVLADGGKAAQVPQQHQTDVDLPRRQQVQQEGNHVGSEGEGEEGGREGEGGRGGGRKGGRRKGERSSLLQEIPSRVSPLCSPDSFIACLMFKSKV